MIVHLETERTLIREVELSDLSDFYAMDSDPEVHKYLGNNPVTTIAESENMISSIRQQYLKNGLGRWAIEDKKTGRFIGWTGLKFEEKLRDFGYYDIGYRLKREFWGQGYATETAKACLKHAFETLNLPSLGAAAEKNHEVSNHILKKIGLQPKGDFIFESTLCNWYEQSKEEWLERHK